MVISGVVGSQPSVNGTQVVTVTSPITFTIPVAVACGLGRLTARQRKVFCVVWTALTTGFFMLYFHDFRNKADPDFSNPSDAQATSLAALVDAQGAPEELDGDMQCLAGAVYFESKGESLEGQLAVARVIINRAKSGRFADSLCGVVYQPSQFSFVRGGHIPTITAGKAYRTAIAVAKVALASAWNSPAPKALFFNTPNRAPGGRLTKIAAIGNHIFYR